MIASAPSNVVLAKPGDEKAVFDFLLLLAEDNGLFNVDSGKSIDMIMRATHGDKSSIGLIRDYKGTIEAASMLALETFWYSSQWYLSEYFNFVHPLHRKSRHAASLLKFQKDFSDKMSKALGQRVGLITGVLTRKRLEPKIRMFQRKYPQVGALFSYNFDLLDDQYNQEMKYKKPTHDRNATGHATTTVAG